MDYAHLTRAAAARLEADPSLLHGDEAVRIVVEWLTWGAEAFESGDVCVRAADDPESQPGIRLARLLTSGVGTTGEPFG